VLVNVCSFVKTRVPSRQSKKRAYRLTTVRTGLLEDCHQVHIYNNVHHESGNVDAKVSDGEGDVWEALKLAESA
jgi:hypothetical protein